MHGLIFFETVRGPLHFCVANNDSIVKSEQLLQIGQIWYQFEEKRSHFHLPIHHLDDHLEV